jgi:cell division protein FtsI/penicillin-binding protein 2
MVEAEFDSRLRGYEDRSEELGVYVASLDTPAERVLTPASARPSKYLGLARASLKKRGDRVCDVRAERPGPADAADEEWRAGIVLEDDEEAVFKKLPRHDLRAFAELLADFPARREDRLRAWAEDRESRTVTLTIDARLQRRLADALRTAAARSQTGASSGVVIDVDTGEVLARGQFPDFDPGSTDIVKAFAAPSFSRMYGPWPDRTGLRGIFQTGSIGKLATALAAARSGRLTDPRGPVFDCKGDFQEKGWGEPIRDHEDDRIHGRLGFERALGASCNIYFGQLGLSLGPEPLIDLFKAGLDIAWYERDAASGFRRFDPGAPGTRLLAASSFGQGALAMNVLQAGRMAAAIGREGRYLVCSPHAVKGDPCEEREILPRTTEAREGNRRILLGMREAMRKGTGQALEGSTPKGVRVYGKTGTAEAPALRDETPYGFRRGQERGLKPHSWFVAIAEPDSNPEASTAAPGRLAVAVVVPRGGLGATAAGPAAMSIISAAESLGYLRPR